MVDNEATAKAASAIQNLLAQGRVQTVVYIDDLFTQQAPIGVEQIIGWFTQALAESKLRVLDIIDVTYPAPDDYIWQSELRNSWEKLSPLEQAEVASKIRDVLSIDGNEVSDKTYATHVRSLFPAKFDYREMPPSQWVKERDAILAELSEGKCMVFLFDQDLSADSGFTKSGTQSGMGLLQSLVTSVSPEKVVCGILSHIIPSVDDEYQFHLKFAHDNELKVSSQDDYLLLTKQRIKVPSQFADGIKKLLLNRTCHLLKAYALDLLDSAHGAGRKKILDIDVYAFDRVVFKAAQKANDDTWEMDTLVRLFQIFQRYEVQARLKSDEHAEALENRLTYARAISSVNTLIEEDTYSRVRALRKIELYQSDQQLKHRPIEMGDIFRFTVSQEHRHYILLAQPCDLAVRRDGKRSQKIVTLAPISIPNEATFPAAQSRAGDPDSEQHTDPSYYRNFWRTRCELDGYCDNRTAMAVVEFKKAVWVLLEVLDLAVLDPEGRCLIDLSDAKIPTHLTLGLQKRLRKVITSYKEQDRKLQELNTDLSSISNEETRNRLTSDFLPKPILLDNSMQVEYKSGFFNFGIARVRAILAAGSRLPVTLLYSVLVA